MDAAASARACSTERGIERIRLAWNGQRGAEFDDANGAWRRQMLAAALAALDAAPLDLLLGLFQAETVDARTQALARHGLKFFGARTGRGGR